jgi:hypothetical protein
VPDQAPPKKPKNFTKMLDMLDTEAAVNTLSPKTYADMVGIFSRKAYENGELEIDEYLKIVKPLFGETGEMVTEKIENYRTNMLEGGDTEYNAMVTEAYIKAGGLEATGMDIDKFAEQYFKKFADGGRAQFGIGSLDPDAELSKRVKELMDDGYEFGQAVKQAMEETRKNQGSGTMPKSEKWMREYFFDGKGGYDDRMSYKEFALGPGQELYKKFGND